MTAGDVAWIAALAFAGGWSACALVHLVLSRRMR
jgi:hypothetical protein